MKRSMTGTRTEHGEAGDLVAKLEQWLGERPEHIPEMSVPPPPGWELRDDFVSTRERAHSARLQAKAFAAGTEKHGMRRTMLAILAFNIYAVCLIGAFQVNTAYLFDTDLIEQLKGSGFDVSPSQWGWGDHYIWRLFSGVVVTTLVSVLTGAIAKERGAKIAALANIPSVLVWFGMIYLYATLENIELDERIGFVVVSVIAIPMTTYIAYFSGKAGEDIQRDFPEKTVLGIRGYHWIWILFPLYLYALGIVFVVTKVILLAVATLWIDMSVVTSMLSLLMLAPIVVWVYPLLIAYRVLTGDMMSNHNAVVRGIANFGILTLGLPVAGGVQFGVYWLLSKAFA